MAWGVGRQGWRIREHAANLCVDCAILNPDGGCLYGKQCVAERVFAMLEDEAEPEVWFNGADDGLVH